MGKARRTSWSSAVVLSAGGCMNRHGLADALVRMGTRAGIAACSGCGAGGLPSWPPSWPRPKREREHLIDNA
jgi:hypothetical protein